MSAWVVMLLVGMVSSFAVWSGLILPRGAGLAGILILVFAGMFVFTLLGVLFRRDV